MSQYGALGENPLPPASSDCGGSVAGSRGAADCSFAVRFSNSGPRVARPATVIPMLRHHPGFVGTQYKTRMVELPSSIVTLSMRSSAGGANVWKPVRFPVSAVPLTLVLNPEGVIGSTVVTTSGVASVYLAHEWITIR